MNARDFLAAAETLPFSSLGRITRGRGLVVVAPHPDDESLGCGGIIAEACRLGIGVRLVVVSDGTGSHPNSKTHPSLKLRELREAETRTAAAELGLHSDAIRFLRLPDRFVQTDGAAAQQARDEIVSAAHEIEAASIFVTWGFDPHCDHAASAKLVSGVGSRIGGARCFAYPVWGHTLPDDTEVGEAPRGFRIDISAHIVAKKRAIEAHRSQTADVIKDDPEGFRLAPDMIARFLRPYEIFLEMG